MSALAAGSLACVNRRADSGTPPVAECLRELATIPEMRALLESRKKDSEEPQPRPLEGMELALTIDGMVRSHVDPDEDVDNLCATLAKPEDLDRLAHALESHKLPPTVSFVTGNTLDQKTQEEWLKRGNLMGSLGYDGRTMKKSASEELAENISLADEALSHLWKKYVPRRKYVRISRRKRPLDEQELQLLEANLKKKNYRLVPATIDLQDERLGQFYCSALERKDQSCVHLIKANFYLFALNTTIHARAIANATAGHEVKQVLVVRPNRFTIDVLAELLSWYKSMGARFISLDDALKDPFYSSPAANRLRGQTKRAQRSAAQAK